MSFLQYKQILIFNSFPHWHQSLYSFSTSCTPLEVYVAKSLFYNKQKGKQKIHEVSCNNLDIQASSKRRNKMVLHCKKWMHLITTDVWLSGVVRSAAAGAGAAVSLAARHSGRGAHRDHATRADPRRSDSRARYDLAKPPPVHVPVPKI